MGKMAYNKTLTWFLFSCGGWTSGAIRVELVKTEQEILVFVIPSVRSLEKEQIDKNMSDNEWNAFQDMLLVDLFRCLKMENSNKLRIEPMDQTLMERLVKYSLCKSISEKEWVSFIDTLLSEVLINEWNNKYEDPNVLDGTQWSFQFKIEEKTRKITGSNKYPSSWKKFLSALDELTAFSMIKVTDYI